MIETLAIGILPPGASITLRKAGSGNDPYHLFGGMLRKDHPPDDWIALTKEAKAYTPPNPEDRG
ncbi:MAG: hypothetical protein WB689_37450 [Xanthobacteraceae bacterium]